MTTDLSALKRDAENAASAAICDAAKKLDAAGLTVVAVNVNAIDVTYLGSRSKTLAFNVVLDVRLDPQ
jgi:hypothetical protein